MDKEDITPIAARAVHEAPESPVDAFMYMPGGIHTINAATLNDQPITATVMVDKSSADQIQKQFETVTARSKGHRVYFDFNHSDDEASFWPTSFEWRESPKPGVYVKGEWSAPGIEAIQGKSYRSFSPLFSIVNPKANPTRITCNPKASLNFGGLVNDPAFKDGLPLWAKNKTQNQNPIMNEQELAQLMAKLQSLETEITGLKAKSAGSENAEAIKAKETEAELARSKIAQAQSETQIKALNVQIKARQEKDADEAIAAAAARGAIPPQDTEIKAKWKKICMDDPTNLALLAALPGNDAVTAGRLTHGNIQLGNEELARVVKAYHVAGSPKERGEIWARDMRKRLENEWPSMIKAANTLGTLTGELITQRTLDLLKYELPVLTRISTDFSAENAAFNQTVKTRLRTVPAVTDYVSGAGYSDSGVTTTDVPVTIDKHKAVSVTFDANELASTRRLLFPEEQEGMHYALGQNITDALFALITAANYANKTTAGLVDFDRSTVIAMKTALNKRKVSGGTRTVILNSDYHGKLEQDVTVVSGLINTGAGGAITTGKLPPIAAFMPIEAPYFPTAGNLVGAGFRADALAIAARVPNDYTTILPGLPATGLMTVVTNPDTGLSVMLAQFVNHSLGAATMRIALMYGVAKGQTDSLERLVSA